MKFNIFSIRCEFCGSSCWLEGSNTQGATPVRLWNQSGNCDIPAVWAAVGPFYPHCLPIPTLISLSSLAASEATTSSSPTALPKPLPFLTSYLPLTPWLFFSLRRFTFLIPSDLSTPHCPFVPALKNLISILSSAAFTFSCSAHILPSHIHGSLTLPLL